MSAPTWVRDQSIIVPTRLQNNTSGGTLRASGSIDLTAAVEAYIYIELGRLGATALANAVPIRITQIPSGSGGPPLLATAGDIEAIVHAFQSGTAASVSTTVNADASAGAFSVSVASAASLAVGDQICISDAGGAAFTRLEFNEIVRINGTTISLLKPLQYSHVGATADIFTRLAEVFGRIPVAGGCVTKVYADYSNSATGSDLVIRAYADVLSAIA